MESVLVYAVQKMDVFYYDSKNRNVHYSVKRLASDKYRAFYILLVSSVIFSIRIDLIHTSYSSVRWCMVSQLPKPMQ